VTARSRRHLDVSRLVLPSALVVPSALACMALLCLGPGMATAAPTAAAKLPAAASPAQADDDDDALPFKLSLPTIADQAAWRTAGFRLQLGYGYGAATGLDGAPDADLHVLIMRVGARLDADWSLLASFQYGIAGGDMVGMRYSGTLDPTWHIWKGLELAFGVGFAGIVEGPADRPDPDAAQRDELVASYTLPDNDPLLPNCSGVGTQALVRLGWSFVIGPLAASTLSVQVDGQWTGCQEGLGRVEPDTATAIVRRQWWAQYGVVGTWTVAWR